jgi:hypothetical protein
MGYFFIFLLETADKSKFHDFLKSTSAFSTNQAIERKIVETYGKSVQQLKEECYRWWTGEDLAGELRRVHAPK